MWKQVKLLKHHPDLLSILIDLLLVLHQLYAVNVDLAGRRHLQKIQAAQKRALSAARRANDTHDLRFINLSIDAL